MLLSPHGRPGRVTFKKGAVVARALHRPSLSPPPLLSASLFPSACLPCFEGPKTTTMTTTEKKRRETREDQQQQPIRKHRQTQHVLSQ